MAGPHTCQSIYCNVLPIGKDELAGSALKASTNGNGTSILTFTIFCVSIPALLFAPTLAFALAPPFNSELFKQFMKAYLEAETQPVSSQA